MDFDKELFKQRLGIVLVCLILVMSGLILIKSDGEEPKFEENIKTEKSEETKGASTTVTEKKPSEDKITEKININTASVEELDKLPGIGEKTAQKIIDYRKSNGKFRTLENIMDVSGIGEAKYEAIKNLISI